MPRIDQLVSQLPLLLRISTSDPQTGAPQIVYDDTRAQGYVVMEASANDLFVS